jgi:hypothetical protein
LRQAFNLPQSYPLTVHEASVLRCWLDALRGSMPHLQFIADRTEGKAPERLSIKGTTLMVVEEIVSAPAVSTTTGQRNPPA